MEERRPQRKRSLGIIGCIWDDNMKMDFQELGGGAWTQSIWLRIGTFGGNL
jgi:hypothetical protein